MTQVRCLTVVCMAIINRISSETEKSVEFVEVEYDDLKGFCVAAKKDLKALATDVIYFAPSSFRVDKMAIEIDNLVRHS